MLSGLDEFLRVGLLVSRLSERREFLLRFEELMRLRERFLLCSIGLSERREFLSRFEELIRLRERFLCSVGVLGVARFDIFSRECRPFDFARDVERFRLLLDRERVRLCELLRDRERDERLRDRDRLAWRLRLRDRERLLDDFLDHERLSLLRDELRDLDDQRVEEFDFRSVETSFFLLLLLDRLRRVREWDR